MQVALLQIICCAYKCHQRSRAHPLVQAAILEDILIDGFVNTQDILYFVDHSFQRPCMQSVNNDEVAAAIQAMTEVFGHAIIVSVAKGTTSTFTSVLLCSHELGLPLYSRMLQV